MCNATKKEKQWKHSRVVGKWATVITHVASDAAGLRFFNRQVGGLRAGTKFGQDQTSIEISVLATLTQIGTVFLKAVLFPDALVHFTTS